MNLNEASIDDLTKVKEINKAKAEAIVEARDTMGGFKSWDDIKQVPGMNDYMINSLKTAGFEV